MEPAGRERDRKVAAPLQAAPESAPGWTSWAGFPPIPQHCMAIPIGSMGPTGAAAANSWREARATPHPHPAPAPAGNLDAGCAQALESERPAKAGPRR